MKIWKSDYNIGIRKGMLVRIQTDEFEYGYGDCHPWTSLGDESLEFQLRALKHGIQTELLERTLYFARKDGQARAQKISLLKNLPEVNNHKTFLSVRDISQESLNKVKELGFKKIKIKISPKFQDDLKKVFSFDEIQHFKLRLDFNGKFGDESLSWLEQNLKFVLDQKIIEWVEDPIPYKIGDWQKLYANFGVELAYDQPRQCKIPEQPYCQFRVIKPAKTDTPSSDVPLVFTHYLDHELGRRQAYHQALLDSQLSPDIEWGFLPETDINQGPAFGYADADIGYGMSSFLQSISWESVV